MEEIIGTHLVHFYLNVQVLPSIAKDWIKEKVETFIDRQKFNLEFNLSSVWSTTLAWFVKIHDARRLSPVTRFTRIFKSNR